MFQIGELLKDLPIDGTWLLVGVSILVLAGLSHLRKMWTDARYGMGGAPKGANTHPAEAFFEAWKTAASRSGLSISETEEELKAPSLDGQLRGLPMTVEMKLKKSGRSAPDPQAINPATISCRIRARYKLPFPWTGVTIRRFICPKSFRPGDVDTIAVGDDQSSPLPITMTRLDRRARRAIAELTNQFDQVTVIDGVLTVVETIEPSRNTSMWKKDFADFLQQFRSQARAFADAGLEVGIENDDKSLQIEMNLAPDPTVPPTKCKVTIITNNDRHDAELATRLQTASMESATSTVDEGKTQLVGLVDRQGPTNIAELVAPF